jgi:hypothetical protein
VVVEVYSLSRMSRSKPAGLRGSKIREIAWPVSLKERH